jgi:hypothetical protein
LLHWKNKLMMSYQTPKPHNKQLLPHTDTERQRATSLLEDYS